MSVFAWFLGELLVWVLQVVWVWERRWLATVGSGLKVMVLV